MVFLEPPCIPSNLLVHIWNATFSKHHVSLVWKYLFGATMYTKPSSCPQYSAIFYKQNVSIVLRYLFGATMYTKPSFYPTHQLWYLASKWCNLKNCLIFEWSGYWVWSHHVYHSQLLSYILDATSSTASSLSGQDTEFWATMYTNLSFYLSYVDAILFLLHIFGYLACKFGV